MHLGKTLFAGILTGILVGLLSSIPAIGALNCCCCLWFLVGGIWLTRWLKSDKGAVDAVDAIVGGLVLGIVASVVYSALNTAIVFMSKDANLAQIESTFEQMNMTMPEQYSFFIDLLYSSPWIVFFANLLFTVLVYPIAGIVGALIGIALFNRKNNSNTNDNETVAISE